MLNLAFIKTLNLESLRYLDEETLVSPACLAKLEEMSEDMAFEYEAGLAAEFYEKLSQLITQYQDGLKQNPDAHNRLIAVLWKVSWKALPALGLKIRRNILSNNLVYALNRGVDVKNILRRVLDPYEVAFIPEENQRREFIYSLESNEEKLGKSLLMLKTGEKVQPTIKNWLANYNMHSPLTAERGAFHEINYLDSDLNTKTLSPQDREILRQVLNIYDWLLFPPLTSRHVTVNEERQVSGTPYMNQQTATLSKETGEAKQPEAPVPPGVRPAKMRISDLMAEEKVGDEKAKMEKGQAAGGKEDLTEMPLQMRPPVAPVKEALPSVNTTSLSPSATSPLKRGEGVEERPAGTTLFSQKKEDIKPAEDNRINGTNETDRTNKTNAADIANRTGAAKPVEVVEEIGTLNEYHQIAGQDAAPGLSFGGQAQAPFKDKGMHSENQKPRLSEVGLASSGVALEPDLSSKDSIAIPGNLSSPVSKPNDGSGGTSLGGGPEGVRTPRAMNDKSGSAPRPAHLDKLYHKAGAIAANKGVPPMAVNMETIKAQMEEKKRKTQAQIDSKLQELEKRVNKTL